MVVFSQTQSTARGRCRRTHTGFRLEKKQVRSSLFNTESKLGSTLSVSFLNYIYFQKHYYLVLRYNVHNRKRQNTVTLKTVFISKLLLDALPKEVWCWECGVGGVPRLGRRQGGNLVLSNTISGLSCFQICRLEYLVISASFCLVSQIFWFIKSS